MPFVMSKKKLARNSELLSARTTLGTITEDTTKGDRIEDSVVNEDQALTSNLTLLRIFRIPKTTKLLLIILLIRLLPIGTLIEGDIVTTLDLNTMPTTTLTRIVT